MLGKVHELFFDPNVNIVVHFNHLYTSVVYTLCIFCSFDVIWFLEELSSRPPDIWHLLRNCEHIYFVAGTDTIVNL